MNRPLVSIGIPVYNGQRSIDQCLRSILSQSYRNIEVVISDNASTDATREICERHAAVDDRVRYYRNERNIGMMPNFRRALELSTGELFTWTCADDVRPADAIEACVEPLLRNPDAVMSHGPIVAKLSGRDEPVIYSNNGDLRSGDAATRVRIFNRELTHNSMIYGVYRRSAVRQAVFGRHLGQDYLLSLQVCMLGPVEYTETPIIIYSERRPRPSVSRMYTEEPLTFSGLVKDCGLRRRKCWTVLVLGCYYGLTLRRVPLGTRLSAISSHVTSFVPLNQRRLAKELVFQAFEPLSLLSIQLWKFLKGRPQGTAMARLLRSLAPSLAPRQIQ